MKKQPLWVLMNIIIIVVVAFPVVGCGGTADTPATPAGTMAGTTTGAATTKTETTLANTTQTSTTIKETETTPIIIEESIDSSPFTKMESILDDLNIVYYEKKWMFAEAIGAMEGYKYSTNSGTFELYLYDIGSEAYAAALKNNAMDVGGTLFPAVIDDGCALYFYNDVPEIVRGKITAAFFQ
jgi:hypothetical protein